MTTLMDLSLVPPAHFEFLRGLRRVYETQTNFFIHANYAPNWKLGEHDSMTALWLPLDDTPQPHYSGKVAIVGHTPPAVQCRDCRISHGRLKKSRICRFRL